MSEALATAQPEESQQPARLHSKKPPTLLYDNGHGTRVSRWEEGVSNIQIERSYKPKDAKEYVTDRINVTPEEALGIIFGLQKGVEQSMGKLQSQRQGYGRG